MRERALDDGDDAGLCPGVGGEVFDGHLGEQSRGDGRRQGGEGGGVLVPRGEVGKPDECGGEAIELDDAPGELRHREDMACAGAGQQHHVRSSSLRCWWCSLYRHCTIFFFPPLLPAL